MNTTGYHKMVPTRNGNSFIGVEYSDGQRVVLMIEGMQGFAPYLVEEEVNALIDALVEARRMMRQ